MYCKPTFIHKNQVKVGLEDIIGQNVHKNSNIHQMNILYQLIGVFSLPKNFVITCPCAFKLYW